MEDDMVSSRAPEDIPSINQVFAILFDILLVITLIVLAFTVPLEKVILTPSTYTNLFNSQNFYNQFPDMLAQMAKQNMAANGDSGSKNILAYVSEPDLANIIRAVVTPEWVKSQTELMVNQLMDFLNLKTDTLVVNIDLKPIKANLQGTGGSQVARTVLTSLPACTLSEWAQLGKALLSKNLDQTVKLCQPPQLLMDLAVTVIAQSLQSMVVSLPDQFTFDAGQITVNSSGQNFYQSPVVGYYRFFRRAIDILPFIVLALLVLIVLLCLRSFRKMLAYLGVPLFSAGVIVLLLSAIVWRLFYAFSSVVNSGQAANPSDAILASIIQGITGQYVQTSAMIGGGLLVVGILLMVWSNFLPKSQMDGISIQRRY
jgi:hypothetical protein